MSGTSRTRIVRTDYLARVEGEGAMHVKLAGRNVEDVKLRIYEPPRFFEALLRGRSFTEAPDITSRICGICPIAYQMSAARAMENACGIAIDAGPLRDLRRLIYFAEWIESHSLHVYMLHAPDFLGYTSAIEMARDHREIVEQGLQMKKTGNAVMTVVGGREIHPINIRVGGFYRAPRRSELLALVDPLERARETALATVRWAATLEFPDVTREPELVALCEPRAYPIDLGRILSDRGLDIASSAFLEHIVEEHVEHSNALHARIRERGSYSRARSRAIASPPPPCGRRRGTPRAMPALNRNAGSRSKTLSSAASSSSRRATRRWRSSTATRSRTARPSRCIRGTAAATG